MHKQETALASVIVPVYNAEKYLNRCIDSILAQTYHNFELILVDDGSTDNSSAICEARAEKDRRIKVIHIENSGCAVARNAGIIHSHGEYVFFVDSDDEVDVNYIQNLFPEADEDLVYAGYRNILSDGVEKICTHHAEYLSCNDLRRDFLQKQITFVWCACYKREIIVRNGVFFDKSASLWEDVSFNLSYLEHCTTIRFSEHTDYVYYQNPQSLINSFCSGRLAKQRAECARVEQFCDVQDFRIRWFYWLSVINHYRKWIDLGDHETKKEAKNQLSKTLNDPFFRESIPYIRKHGSLDERIETFFMRSWLHPMYKPVYGFVIFLSKIKNHLLRKNYVSK